MVWGRRRASALALLTFGLLAACADLKVVKPDGNAPIAGMITYYLPRTAVTVTVAASVTQCGTLSAGEIDDADPPKPSDIKFKVTTVTVPATEPDPDREYAINYAESQTWLKEMNFSVSTSPTRVFAGLNASINDQGGPIAVAALQAAVQIAGAAIIPKPAAVNSLKTVKARNAFRTFDYLTLDKIYTDNKDAASLCSDDVRKALIKIVETQRTIKDLRERIARYRSQTLTADPLPGKTDPIAAWSQAIAALQADIADKTANALTRTIVTKWLPGPLIKDGTSGNYYEWKQIPVNGMIGKLLSDEGKIWYNDEANIAVHTGFDGDQAKFWRKAHMPASIILVVDKDTYFDNTGYGAEGSGKPLDPLTSKKLKGLVLRDSVTAFVQPCTAADAAIVKGPDGKWRFQAQPCTMPSFTDTDISPKSDDGKRVALTLPQFGRPHIYTVHSGVFENATLAITLNTDGTLQQVSTKDVSTAAQGLSGVATAASAAASAETARNNAITAANTAATAAIQLPATTNKALADCQTQAAAVVAGGGKPVPCAPPPD